VSNDAVNQAVDRNMRAAVIIALCALLALLAICANCERVNGNIDEGPETRGAIVHPSSEQKPSVKSMSYQVYEGGEKASEMQWRRLNGHQKSGLARAPRGMPCQQTALAASARSS
jgi:hypothetical protein